MDYRTRKYYLVSLGYLKRARLIKWMRSEVKSLKIHPPYGHFKYAFGKENGYDGMFKDISGMGYVQNMMSCRNEESEALERIFKNPNALATYFEITRDNCGQ